MEVEANIFWVVTASETRYGLSKSGEIFLLFEYSQQVFQARNEDPEESDLILSEKNEAEEILNHNNRKT